MWYLGECACRKFVSTESKLEKIIAEILNLEEVVLLVVTPIPFLDGWGAPDSSRYPTKNYRSEEKIIRTR